VGVFGKLEIVGGRVEETDFHKETMQLRVGERWLELPLTVTRKHFVRAGAHFDFAVRKNLLFRKTTVARAFRASNGKVRPARTLHYWLGILYGLVIAAIVIHDCTDRWGCSEQKYPRALWGWLAPFVFTYCLLAIIETWQAVRQMRNTNS
jgi:hypothetical protein